MASAMVITGNRQFRGSDHILVLGSERRGVAIPKGKKHIPREREREGERENKRKERKKDVLDRNNLFEIFFLLN